MHGTVHGSGQAAREQALHMAAWSSSPGAGAGRWLLGARFEEHRIAPALVDRSHINPGGDAGPRARAGTAYLLETAQAAVLGRHGCQLVWSPDQVLQGPQVVEP